MSCWMAGIWEQRLEGKAGKREAIWTGHFQAEGEAPGSKACHSWDAL